MAVNQETTAGNSFTIEFRKLFRILCVFTIESIAQVFKKERFVLQLALNLKTDYQPLVDRICFSISYKLHGSILCCY